MERDDDSPGEAAPSTVAAPGEARAAAGGGGKGPGTAAGTGNVTELRPRKGRAKPYERPRGGPARQVSELVPQIGRTAFRKFGFVQSSVVTRWPEIVGEHHAKVCAPESIRFPGGPAGGEKRAGTLHLVVMPAHAPLIQHVIPEIISRVNRFFGYEAVTSVRMRQGHVQPRRAEGAPRAAPSLRPIPLELGESLRDIGDAELRTVLESLARSLGGDDERPDGERDAGVDETR